jgi:hypothetical protein
MPSSPLLVAISEANVAAHRYFIGRQPADWLFWSVALRRIHIEAERTGRAG